MSRFPNIDQKLILTPKNGKPIFIFICGPNLTLSVALSSESSRTTFLWSGILIFYPRAKIFAFPFSVNGNVNLATQGQKIKIPALGKVAYDKSKENATDRIKIRRELQLPHS